MAPDVSLSIVPMASNRQLAYISVSLVCVATLVHIIAFATPGWSGSVYGSAGSQYIGLWQYCNKGSGCRPHNLNDLNSRLRGVQAMECLALIAFIAASAFGILFLIKRHAHGNFGMAIAAIVAGVFALIGVMIFGTDKSSSYTPFYSFGLCIVGALLGFAGGIVALCNR